jgi:NADH:ubiquinone oxidoreductase subunit 5 (subunit L)/multisubunit Na+/H+ antiporter MnhA subunit
VLLGSGFAPAPATDAPVLGVRETGLFALALFGFGVKAGVVPLHVWLPEAHAAAPSHVSALMSGAMVKLGFYGILRVLLCLGGALASWGSALAVLGLIGAFVGAAGALAQRDLKRALAQSSVENLGLISLGLGIGLGGLVPGDRALAALGLGAALLHVWNHAALKGTLFLAAGSVQHGAGTRDLEHLGGLLRAMPRTGLLFGLGAVGLAALPPLNAFASEWLLYLGLLQGTSSTAPLRSLAAALALGWLALVGALAATAFARLFGIAFLGEPRSHQARAAHDEHGASLAAMLVLALACVAAGLAPVALLGCVEAPLRQLGSLGGDSLALGPVASALAPLQPLALGVWLALALGGVVLSARLRRVASEADGTWACGYAVPVPRAQYTASSFSELFAQRVLPRALAAPLTLPRLAGPQPGPTRLLASYDGLLVRRLYEPLLSSLATACAGLRRLQQGHMHLYLAYILVAVMAALAWSSLGGWLPP